MYPILMAKTGKGSFRKPNIEDLEWGGAGRTVICGVFRQNNGLIEDLRLSALCSRVSTGEVGRRPTRYET